MNAANAAIRNSKNNKQNLVGKTEMRQRFQRKSRCSIVLMLSANSRNRQKKGLRYEISLVPLFLGLLNPYTKVINFVCYHP